MMGADGDRRDMAIGRRQRQVVDVIGMGAR